MNRREFNNLLVVCLLIVVIQVSGNGGEALKDARMRSLADAHGLHLEEVIKCGLPVIAFTLDVRGESVMERISFRPTTQVSVLRGSLRIHFDTSGIHSPAMLDATHQRIPGSYREFIDSVAEAANLVINLITTDLGYPAPPADFGGGGGDEFDIYIQELGNLYGLTNPELSLSSRRFTTFIEIDNDFIFVSPDSNKGIPAARVTLAHELHHAIQLGNYGFWGFEQIPFYEMTSVWIEDVVYPDVNDYFGYLTSSGGVFRRPETPFTSTFPASSMYSKGIWCHYLAKAFSPGIIRRMWEHIRQMIPVVAINQALQEPGNASSFRLAFADWIQWNYFTGSRDVPGRYYPEGDRYPLVVERPIGYTPPVRIFADSLGPLATRYHQVIVNTDTLVLALANIDFAEASAGNEDKFPYTLTLQSTRIDETYRETGTGVFVKLNVEDPSNWFLRFIVNGGIPVDLSSPLSPFPSPFRADGRSSLYLPVRASARVEGTLHIFSAGMNRIFSSRSTSNVILSGMNVFSWNGRTDSGQIAGSGVYIYVLELPGEVVKGKIVVMRE